MQNLLVLAGIGHFALCLGSLFIPKSLRWSEELSVLRPFFRQMFWTYAGYILVINFSFGLISVMAPDELLNKSFLASAVTLFIGAYWLARITLQFALLDKSDVPKKPLYFFGEIALVTLFATFTVVYSMAFAFNQSWIP